MISPLQIFFVFCCLLLLIHLFSSIFLGTIHHVNAFLDLPALHEDEEESVEEEEDEALQNFLNGNNANEEELIGQFLDIEHEVEILDEIFIADSGLNFL